MPFTTYVQHNVCFHVLTAFPKEVLRLHGSWPLVQYNSGEDKTPVTCKSSPATRMHCFQYSRSKDAHRCCDEIK